MDPQSHAAATLLPPVAALVDGAGLGDKVGQTMSILTVGGDGWPVWCTSPGDLGASISSGSFRTEGMLVAPCSVKSLAAIANGYAEGLNARAADVGLKECRRLVLMVREAPLSEIHLENMLELARMGASIVPPVPGFHTRPRPSTRPSTTSSPGRSTRSAPCWGRHRAGTAP